MITFGTMDRLTLEQRANNMKAIKSKGSKIERTLAKALWNSGIRYRKNDQNVFGIPDFTITRYKIAIFCDSEFWHGKDWAINKNRFKTNIEFWQRKIESNIKRDLTVNNRLRDEGWIIVRFWGKEIMVNPIECVKKVSDEIEKRENTGIR